MDGVDIGAVFCSGWAAYCGELLSRVQLLHLCLWPHRQWKDLHNVGTSDRRGPPEPGQQQACCVVVWFIHSCTPFVLPSPESQIALQYCSCVFPLPNAAVVCRNISVRCRHIFSFLCRADVGCWLMLDHRTTFVHVSYTCAGTPLCAADTTSRSELDQIWAVGLCQIAGGSLCFLLMQGMKSVKNAGVKLTAARRCEG